MEELNNSRYKVYECKDGRMRVYDKETKKVRSYPRLISELNGSELPDDSDVHHKDGNPLNNDPDNLEVIPHGTHQRIHSQKYIDEITTCEYCKRRFLWKAISQRNFYNNKNRRPGMAGPFCSKKCSGLYSTTKK